METIVNWDFLQDSVAQMVTMHSDRFRCRLREVTNGTQCELEYKLSSTGRHANDK